MCSTVRTYRKRNGQHGTMPPVAAVGPLRMRWRTARDDHWRVELLCLQTTAQCRNATGGQNIQSGRDNATAKIKQRRVNQTGEGAVQCKLYHQG